LFDKDNQDSVNIKKIFSVIHLSPYLTRPAHRHRLFWVASSVVQMIVNAVRS